MTLYRGGVQSLKVSVVVEAGLRSPDHCEKVLLPLFLVTIQGKNGL